MSWTEIVIDVSFGIGAISALVYGVLVVLWGEPPDSPDPPKDGGIIIFPIMGD